MSESGHAASEPPSAELTPLTWVSTALISVSGVCLLLITFSICFEVIARYFFHSPTIWAWDVAIQLLILMIMFGLADVYHRNMYVRVDAIFAMLSPRGQTIVNILFAPVALAIVGIVVWVSWRFAIQSWNRNEMAGTLLNPPIWPIKFTLVIGPAVLFAVILQTLARDIRSLRSTDGGKHNSADEARS